jgi:hypothetical protein
MVLLLVVRCGRRAGEARFAGRARSARPAKPTPGSPICFGPTLMPRKARSRHWPCRERRAHDVECPERRARIIGHVPNAPFTAPHPAGGRRALRARHPRSGPDQAVNFAWREHMTRPFGGSRLKRHPERRRQITPQTPISPRGTRSDVGQALRLVGRNQTTFFVVRAFSFGAAELGFGGFLAMG